MPDKTFTYVIYALVAVVVIGPWALGAYQMVTWMIRGASM